ncbi:M23 family metallopeptidase [Sporosarcina aquimarina]|uniref:M23 family metallopeptidase n=1 Tax=Sporosarcina aquimarina TaxID=114975 RepID=UPI00203F33D9|nr:M23 family metallopeptidase [Sporosarcina aquimarina]MCM3756091.1 M23 family metallopeptidase [Sporosarcina aquimarina]
MREEKKPNAPSQKNKSTKSNWFWPTIYASFALLFVGMVWGYNALMKPDAGEQAAVDKEKAKEEVTLETNASNEQLKYPFDEALLDQVAIIQDFYDAKADASSRENALLVFKQTYVTNEGVTIAVDGKPFEVLAAMSGKVEQIVSDPFKGSEIVISHKDGLKTIYRSVTGILVKEGDEIQQGEALAQTAENEWNPQAGVHLHFEVQKDDVAVNPRSFLAF